MEEAVIHPVVRKHFKYAKNVDYGFIMQERWHRNSVNSGWRTWYRFVRKLGEYAT